MTKADKRRFQRRFDRIEHLLPRSMARALRWLRDPSARLIRIPVGVLFVVGGLLSFLPVLGVWMLPLGLLLLAEDLHFLKRPTSRILIQVERRWTQWRRRWRQA